MDLMVTHTLWRINKFFLEKKIAGQVLVLMVTSYLLAMVVLPLEYLVDSGHSLKEQGPKVHSYFSAIIIAPLLETTIFQLAVFRPI